ncbi:MAG: right-handed parallel beta-helix repeat-containing protein [Planctomycetota bacterium]|jgi:hypothetical protein
MKNKLQYLVLVIALLSVTNTLQATDYYIAFNGNDDNPGTSPQQPWKSIAKVNQTKFNPTDSILFEGGHLFFGSIKLDSEDSGTAKKPVTIGSYGRERAIIASGQKHGLHAHNCRGLVVKDLIFIGDGRTINTDFSGVYFTKDTLPEKRLSFFRVDNIDVSGYRNGGIYFKAGGNNEAGFKDIRITNSVAHDNGDKGICIWSGYNTLTKPNFWPHEDVYIAHCKAYNNSGNSGQKGHTGNGIIISQINRGVIEYCEAYNNGWLCDDPDSGGPIGIWTWDSKEVIIQFCESHHNKSNNGKDGGGFDIDGGCVNCIIQYNYSHDNHASGYGIYQFDKAREFKDNIVRYNISENDGLVGSYGALNLWATNSSGGLQNTLVYNNTFYASPNTGGACIADFPADGSGKTYIHDMKIYNNIIVTTPGKTVIDIPIPADEWTFKGNCYWTCGGDVKIAWNKNTYTSLDQWRKETNQETLNGKPVGFEADPKLKKPGHGGTIGAPAKLVALSNYKLQSDSPLIDKALNLKSVFNIDPGLRDYCGTALPQSSGYDVGACEATRK